MGARCSGEGKRAAKRCSGFAWPLLAEVKRCCDRAVVLRDGRNAGEFHWVHNLAIDSKGNLYTTEVDTGKRAQKFRYIGPAVAK